MGSSQHPALGTQHPFSDPSIIGSVNLANFSSIEIAA